MADWPHVARQMRGTRAVGLSLALALSSAFVAGGCDEEAPVESLPPAYIIGANPRLGIEVPCGTPVNLVFNRDPGLVRSLHADLDPARQTGTRRRFRMGGYYGPVEFVWGDGETLAAYYVSCEASPATLDGTTPDTFDPAIETLNTDGLILHFSEPVVPTAAGWAEMFIVADSAGNERHPSVSADGADVTIRPPAGRPFVAGERYHLTREVLDAGGDVTVIDLEFPMKGDE